MRYTALMFESLVTIDKLGFSSAWEKEKSPLHQTRNSVLLSGYLRSCFAGIRSQIDRSCHSGRLVVFPKIVWPITYLFLLGHRSFPSNRSESPSFWSWPSPLLLKTLGNIRSKESHKSQPSDTSSLPRSYLMEASERRKMDAAKLTNDTCRQVVCVDQDLKLF